MKRTLALIGLVLAMPLGAEIRPQAGGGDPRIQTVLYDPEQVVQLQVASGYQLTVELGPDERIENIAVGDSGAWQITPNKRGDHLFIKMGLSGSSTNLTVITDSRTYAFVLTPAYDVSGEMAFTVRFRYPPTGAPLVGEAPPPADSYYKLAGTRALRPAAVTDDGTRTFISFGDDQTMPAVFAIDADGNERLVDGAVRDGRYVIDGVSNRLLFRLEKRTATATRVLRRKAR